LIEVCENSDDSTKLQLNDRRLALLLEAL